MKRLATILQLALLLALANTTHAQDWHPFPGGSTLEYGFLQNGSPDTWFITTQFDSVRAEGADSAYYFYRVDRALLPSDTGTTCSGGDIHNAPRPVLSNQDHYLGRKILWNPNGEAQFIVSNGDTVFLQTQATQGLVWTWRIGVTATVDSIVAGTVLGDADSLKYIRLSNGPAWILSKAHGLVQCSNLLPFPDISGMAATVTWNLSAIPARALGQPIPRYGDIFQFGATDKFGYEYNQDFHPGTQTDYYEVIVQSQTPASQFQYQTTRERFQIHRPFQAPIDSNYFAPSAFALVYDSLQFPLLALEPYAHVPPIPNFFGQAIQGGVHASAAMHNRVLVELQLTGGFDTCAQIYYAGIAFGNQQFGAGLGETYYRWFNIMTPSSRELYCYAKGSESWGTCRNLSTLSAVADGFAGRCSISPNPAQDRLRLELPAEMRYGDKTLRIIGLDGRTQHSETMAAGEYELEIGVEALAAGMYWLVIDQMGVPAVPMRFVVQR